MLLDAPLRDQGSAFGNRTLGYSLRFARPTIYDNISPIEVAIQPSLLEEQFDGEEAAEDGSEDDEEDARPGVGASAPGGPSPGVERSGGRGEEDHFHHRRRHCQGSPRRGRPRRGMYMSGRHFTANDSWEWIVAVAMLPKLKSGAIPEIKKRNGGKYGP